ncbi:MAG: class I SAM-dependent methyltransferase [Acutalibacteraceae bacterium]|nr:class I SAM-dependent methyltransferase [Acutalibacteraceae bacterium]
MSVYKDFAFYYDALTLDVNYKERTEYLCSLFEKYDRMPSLLLDLACGTGNFSVELAAKGIQVIGVEPSSDMLSVAMQKATENIMYLCQSAEELELYGTVDGAVCCLDSINHITDADTLKKAFERVTLFLEKDRLFIFDVNTEYKHREILGNNTFVTEQENIFCVWQNFYDESEKITDINIDIFEEENGSYNRICEDFSERCYSRGELEAMLNSAGLKIEAVFDEMTFDAPKSDSERIVYVVRRV